MSDARIGSVLVKAFGLLKAFGARAPEDGWRMSARVHLRGEIAKFALAALGLRVDSGEEAVLAKLATFLREQPIAGQALEWHRFSAIRVPKTTTDLVWARFDPAGRLISIEARLDEREPVPYDRFIRAFLADLVCDAYNETRELPDLERPLALQQHAMSRIGSAVSRAALPHDAREAAVSWIWRVLTATMVTFEQIDEASRFVLPQWLDTRHFGHGLFNVRIRRGAEGVADLWWQVNHAAVDGVPVQEMLDALVAEWGADEVSFPVSPVEPDQAPAPNGHSEGGVGDAFHGTVVRDLRLSPAPAPLPSTFSGDSRAPWERPVRCSPDPEPPRIYAALDFLDMSGFLEVRRELGGASPTAMLLWALAHQPAFADRKFAVATDVPPLEGAEPGSAPSRRTVCFIVMRPADYFPGAFEGAGFGAFAEAFAEEAAATRARTSTPWRLLESTAPMPAAQQEWSARLIPQFGHDSIGTVGVSVIRRASIFEAPWHPVFVDGFVALGDFRDGRCAITCKAARRRLEACRDALRAVAAEPRRYFPR
jgi:hypothetical protein